jgi:hypothetical protein
MSGNCKELHREFARQIALGRLAEEQRYYSESQVMQSSSDDDEKRPTYERLANVSNVASGRYRLKLERANTEHTREEAMSGDNITKEDFREFTREVREGQEGIREEIRGIVSALNAHSIEDAEREGKAGRELSSMRAKLESLSEASSDRHRFMRGWIGGLIALAVAAGMGFLFRSAVEVQIARPSPPAPAAPALAPAPAPAPTK